MAGSKRKQHGFNYFKSARIAFQTSAAGGIVIGISALFTPLRQDSGAIKPQGPSITHVEPAIEEPAVKTQNENGPVTINKHPSEPRKTFRTAATPPPSPKVENISPAERDRQSYQRFISHLYEREGCCNTVYRDSTGHLTVGVGHKVRARDALQEGDRISNHTARALLETDARHAYSAAKQQAMELGVSAHRDFIVALAAVNYQLGTEWFTVHKKTWALMKQGRFADAAIEAADSKWFRETPLRVHDFQDALNKLARDIAARRVSSLHSKFRDQSGNGQQQTALVVDISGKKKSHAVTSMPAPSILAA